MSDCSCQECAKLCVHMPGWMTIDEAEMAINAGLGPRLMRDWLEPSSEYGNDERIYVICPGAVGHEGGDAAEMDELYPDGWLSSFFGGAIDQPCIFHKDGRCDIHTSGFKPRQCREAFGCRENEDWSSKYVMAREWDSERGRALVARWQAGQYPKGGNR